MQNNGSVYSWYASKQIAAILNKQEKKKEAVIFLEKIFKKNKNQTLYEIFN